VVVATSSQPENTMPVTGLLRGDATSTLDTQLTMERLR
jgi:hypothetical protein